MQSDFDVMCKRARARIAVPAVPLAAIRSAAQCRPAQTFARRRKGIIAALFAGVSVVAVAAAAEVWNTHVSYDTSGALQVSADKLKFTQNPTSEDLRTAARQADFPVVLPAGLPRDTTLRTMARAGSSALLLQYNLPGAWRRSDHVLWLALANPKARVSPSSVRGGYMLRMAGGAARGSVHWTIGHEDVFVMGSTMTPAELAHMKSAMTAQSSRSNATRSRSTSRSPSSR